MDVMLCDLKFFHMEALIIKMNGGKVDKVVGRWVNVIFGIFSVSQFYRVEIFGH